MASKRHLFILDPFAKLNLQLDTSLRLAMALMAEGDEVFGTEVKDLSVYSKKRSTSAHAYRIGFKRQNILEPEKQKHDSPMLLEEFDAIHVRKDPPFDLAYITMTWMLNSVGLKTKVYNTPESLRNINEKLGILHYPAAIKPCLVSANPSELLDFVKHAASGDAIIKPLYLYGGKGISRLNLEEQSEEAIMQLLFVETKQATQQLLIQAFDTAIYDGEVRAFCVGGKPLAWCLKKPMAGQFMANSNFNSTRHTYAPSMNEFRLVSEIAGDLLKKGVFVVGFDLIDGYLSEINITSPRLLVADDDKEDYYANFAAWIREDLGA